jgi:hypothetical protein
MLGFGKSEHTTNARVRRGASLLTGRRARLTALLAGGAVLIPAVTAQATTGADALNKPPIFKVTKAQAAPFIGGYQLSAHGAGVITSTLRTGYNTEGYLMGTISVTRYVNGQPGTFVASLYEYRRKGAAMLVDLWTPDLGSDRLGLLNLTRSGSKLTGTLTIGATPVSVTYKSVSANSAQSTVNSAATSSITTDALTTNAGIFSTAVVLAESINPT